VNPAAWTALTGPHPLRAHLDAVARLAASLARRHGADPRRARLAALLHDRLKPWPAARLAALLARYHERLDADTRRVPELWHGPAGAAWARRVLGVRDREVLDAVRWHSTGRPGLGVTGRILFVADFCAEGRAFPEARAGRRIALRRLDAGLRFVIGAKLAWLRGRRLPVHRATLDLWREMAGTRG
jgi:predicted HD superfamily hydrolase involved in NAD metabolism